MHNYSKIDDKPVLRAYGKYVAQLLHHISTMEVKEKRNECATGIANIMRKKHASHKHELPIKKCWDDLFVLVGHDVEIESPFPRLAIDAEEKPVPMSYNRSPIAHRAYGMHVANFFKTLLAGAYDNEKREVGIGLIVQFMWLLRGKPANLNKMVYDIQSITKDSIDITVPALQQIVQKASAEQASKPLDRKRHYQKQRKRRVYHKR